MILLYVFFALSLFCPIYTYTLYPIALKLFDKKKLKSGEVDSSVTVVVVGENCAEKIKNVDECEYQNFDIISGDYRDTNKAKGTIIVFTDTRTKLDQIAINEIVKPFADERVGVVVGQQTNPEGNSSFWKYENFVKKLESGIGCVSGANESLFAVRASDMPVIDETVLNKPFYIATKITENGKYVVFQESAKTYERTTGGVNFSKHVQDAAGYWQALKLFPKMLFGGLGSFVYVGHRVMKWFVWLNMVMLLVISGLLAVLGSSVFGFFFVIQLLGYVTVLLLGKRKIPGTIGRLIGIGYYFILLNVSYLMGLLTRNNQF